MYFQHVYVSYVHLFTEVNAHQAAYCIAWLQLAKVSEFKKVFNHIYRKLQYTVFTTNNSLHAQHKVQQNKLLQCNYRYTYLFIIAKITGVLAVIQTYQLNVISF